MSPSCHLFPRNTLVSTPTYEAPSSHHTLYHLCRRGWGVATVTVARPVFLKSFPGKWQRALFVCVTCAYTLCGPAPAKPSWLCYDCSQNAPASSFHPLPLSAGLCRLSSDLVHRLTPELGKRKKPRFGLTACQSWIVSCLRASWEVAERHGAVASVCPPCGDCA